MTFNKVFCVAVSEQQAERIAKLLKMAEFRRSEVSVLFPDKPETWSFAERAVKDGALGDGLRWLVEGGALTIPGFGFLIAAGPIMAALAGAAIVRAKAGGIIAALMSLGISKPAAELYERKLRAGSILISIRVDEAAEVDEVVEIFERAGARDVLSTKENFIKVTAA